jgi:hypothetical protein
MVVGRVRVMMVLDLMAMNFPNYLDVRPRCNVMTMTRPDPPNVAMNALLSNVGVKLIVYQYSVLVSIMNHRLAPLGARLALGSGKHQKADNHITVAMLEREMCMTMTDLVTLQGHLGYGTNITITASVNTSNVMRAPRMTKTTWRMRRRATPASPL